MSKPVLIVGAGLFGQVIAAKLRRDGHEVTVFDRREPEAGSPPSGGHLKPSWLNFLNRVEMDAAFRTLDELYKMETLRCRFLIKDVDLMRIDVDSVLRTGKVTEACVTSVGDGWIEVNDPNNSQSTLRFTGRVIVAAGAWSAQLLPQLSDQLSVKKGISWTFTGVKTMPTNVIAPWAPYKQVVRTYHGLNTVWIGDGTAIKPENWDQAREEQIRGRIMSHVDFKYKKLELRRGLRPYMANGFQKLGNNLWVATGGGKSGMCLAGVYANRLSNLLG